MRLPHFVHETVNFKVCKWCNMSKKENMRDGLPAKLAVSEYKTHWGAFCDHFQWPVQK